MPTKVEHPRKFHFRDKKNKQELICLRAPPTPKGEPGAQEEQKKQKEQKEQKPEARIPKPVPQQ